METFSERLTSALESANMNRTQLAERLEISPSTITRWYTEGSLPQRRVLKPLAQILSVNADWLVSGSGRRDALYVARDSEESEILNVKESPCWAQPVMHYEELFRAYLSSEDTPTLLSKLKTFVSSNDPRSLLLAQVVLEEINARAASSHR